MCLWLGFTFEQKDCPLSFVRDVIYLYGLKNKLRDAFDLFGITDFNLFQFTLARHWKAQKSVLP